MDDSVPAYARTVSRAIPEGDVKQHRDTVAGHASRPGSTSSEAKLVQFAVQLEDNQQELAGIIVAKLKADKEHHVLLLKLVKKNDDLAQIVMTEKRAAHLLHSDKVETLRKEKLRSGPPSPTETRDERAERRDEVKKVEVLLEIETEALDAEATEITRMEESTPATLRSIAAWTGEGSVKPARKVGTKRVSMVGKRSRQKAQGVEVGGDDNVFYDFISAVVDQGTEDLPAELKKVVKKVKKRTQVWLTPEEMDVVGELLSGAKAKFGCSQNDLSDDIEKDLEEDFLCVTRTRLGDMARRWKKGEPQVRLTLTVFSCVCCILYCCVCYCALFPYYPHPPSSISTRSPSSSFLSPPFARRLSQVNGGTRKKKSGPVSDAEFVNLSQEMADADRTFARSQLIQGLHRAAARTALERGKSGIVKLTESQIRDLMEVVGGFSDSAYKVQWATEPRDRATHSMRSALACAAAMHALFFGGQEEFGVSAEWAGKMVGGEYVNGTSRHMITNTDAFTVAFNLHVETSECQHYHVSRHSTPLKENGAGRQGGMLTQSIKCIPIASAGGDYGRSVWVWQLKEGEQPPVGAVQQGAVDGVWMLPLVGMRTATIEQEDDIFLIYRHDVPPQVVYESHRVVLDSFIDALRSKYFDWAVGDTVTQEMRAGTVLVFGLKTGY